MRLGSSGRTKYKQIPIEEEAVRAEQSITGIASTATLLPTNIKDHCPARRMALLGSELG